MTDNTTPDKLADLLPITDEVRVAAQIAIWQALESEGVKPTSGMVRIVRADVEEIFAAALSNTRPIEAEEANSRVLTSEQGEGVEDEVADDVAYLRWYARYVAPEGKEPHPRFLDIAERLEALSASPIPVTPDEGLAAELADRVRALFGRDDCAAGVTSELSDGKRYIVMPYDHYEADLMNRQERGRQSALRRPTEAADQTRTLLDGNDIWEALFGIMKGDVPDGMTEDVCQQLADYLSDAHLQGPDTEGGQS